MDFKKYIKGLFVCTTVAACTIFTPGAAGAEGQEPQPVMTIEEALQDYTASGYKYTSERYGYSIVCPEKPVGVIPLSAMIENERGDVLVFANEGYSLKRAWIVMINAFNDQEVPPDLDKMNEQQQKALIDNLMNTSGYEFVRIADINGRKGIYAVTAKVIDIDTDGDGKPDTTAEADTQMIKTYFTGQFGGRFSVQLIDNPELTQAGVQTYQLGICTFQEWPTKMNNGKNVGKDNKAENKKIDQKAVKKDKKKSK